MNYNIVNYVHVAFGLLFYCFTECFFDILRPDSPSPHSLSLYGKSNKEFLYKNGLFELYEMEKVTFQTG